MTDRSSIKIAKRTSLALLAAGALLAFANTPVASAQETLAASCPPPAENTFETPGIPVAHNFTAEASGNLTRAEVMLSRVAGTENPITVQIWTADTDGNPVTLLSTGTILAANVPEGTTLDDLALVGVVFDTAAPVVAGQQYAIVLQREGGQYRVGTRSNDDCLGEFRRLPADTWLKLNRDLVFSVFVEPPGAPPVVTCKGEQVTIVGTSVDDRIVGTAGRDVIAALDGNDDVRGLDGKDIICGGGGHDLLRGQDGNDKIKGNIGRDRLKGGFGEDRLRGNRGRDILKGKARDDSLNGGRNNDVCRGGDGDDKIKNCES